MKKALIIFVKAPVAGQVKTRLQPYLPADKTAELYKSFISVIVSKCVGMKGIDVFLACAPTKDNDFLKEVSIKYRIKSFNQRGKDLGEKMVNAFRDHHKKGYKEILIIGSDSPTIPKGFIRKAFSELSKNDFVIGPCCDGGLYLAGAKGKVPKVFKDVPWDTAGVLNKVMSGLNSLDIRFSMLPFWYDIDTISDLKLLENHLQYLTKKKLKDRKR